MFYSLLFGVHVDDIIVSPVTLSRNFLCHNGYVIVVILYIDSASCVQIVKFRVCVRLGLIWNDSTVHDHFIPIMSACKVAVIMHMAIMYIHHETACILCVASQLGELIGSHILNWQVNHISGHLDNVWAEEHAHIILLHVRITQSI